MSGTIRCLVVLGIVLGLFAGIFGDAILCDRNFIYRDAGHFYYPFLKLVQDEWKANRWPLWNPYENGGMPLLGNPAAAVLYPPRVVIFQWLPMSYAAQYKSYVLFHVLLCAAAAYAMARNWQLSTCAAGLAAIGYAFGAPIMFQYSNVIFLVGAAWVPLGLLATDRLVRDGSWCWAIALGLVLVMQMLGGDPEAAYVTGGLAAVYLAMLDAAFGLCVAGSLGAIYCLKLFVLRQQSGSPGDIALILVALLLILSAPAVTMFLRWRRGNGSAPNDRAARWRRRACLAFAAAVALGGSAVQWLPSWEFSRISVRAVGGVHLEPYAFWIAPWRVAEMIWPNISGLQFPINTRWLDIFVVGDRTWEPSLYFGVLGLVLAGAAWRIRNVPVWQRWLSITLVLSLWAATGPAGGVSWYLKMSRLADRDGISNSPSPSNQPGDRDTADASADRPVKLETPAGGLYWVLIELLPGFGTFRYPAKLLTFATVAFAALAALGWDRLFGHAPGRSTHIHRAIGFVALASLALTIASVAMRSRLEQRFASSWLANGTEYYGPLVPSEAAWRVVRAFGTTAASLALVLGVHWLARRRFDAGMAHAAVLVIVAIDLGLANRWMVSTAPQALIDTAPSVRQIIAQAEAAEEGSGPKQPFRVHRVSLWAPPRWITRISPDQDEEVFRWEKDTIQPKYGLLQFSGLDRISYTINEGTLEPYDYWWFFAPFYSNTTPEPRSVVYHPIRGYDMWGAKYFVLPKGTKLDDQNRGVTTFMMRSEPIADSPMDQDDYQVRRNPWAFPRAWIVHRLIYRKPISGLAKADRMSYYREILYTGTDPLWYEGKVHVQDPRQVAWIEHPDAAYAYSLQGATANSQDDRCEIVEYESDRVVIDVETSARGVMVLADLYYPGWELTVDGRPTPVLRVNRMMRGVPLEPGKHRVVFLYNPLSFRVGGMISLASLTLVVLAGVLCLRQRFTRVPVSGTR